MKKIEISGLKDVSFYEQFICSMKKWVDHYGISWDESDCYLEEFGYINDIRIMKDEKLDLRKSIELFLSLTLNKDIKCDSYSKKIGYRFSGKIPWIETKDGIPYDFNVNVSNEMLEKINEYN